jgi:hypothetical protein
MMAFLLRWQRSHRRPNQYRLKPSPIVGYQIGGKDLSIAAQSISLRFTFLTDKERKFSRIVQLPCTN